MTPDAALEMYVAIKLHFSTKHYDAVKFNFQVKNALNFNKRKDKTALVVLARQPDVQGLLIANLSYDPTMWVGDIVDQDGKGRYMAWKKRQESISYLFKEEIKKLKPDFDENFVVKENQHPYALKLYLKEAISLDTLSIIDAVVGYYPHWMKELKDDVVWSTMQYRIPKYRQLLAIDGEKFRSSLKNQFR